MQIRKHWLNNAAAPTKLCVCLAVSLSLWGTPAAYIDVADVWPLSGWLSGVSLKGYHMHGGIAAAPYLAISQIVSNALVRMVVPDAWT